LRDPAGLNLSARNVRRFSMARILIVDDMADNSRPLARMLRHAGFEADSVESGAEALTFVEKTPPDLVLLDVMMPE